MPYDRAKAQEIMKSYPDLTMDERRKIWIEISDPSEAELQELWADHKARQSRVPQVGDEAPDFELDLLDKETGRTGEKVKLSGLRGKPVGIVFGSFT